jgi:hypothetical protein
MINLHSAQRNKVQKEIAVTLVLFIACLDDLFYEKYAECFLDDLAMLSGCFG